MKKTLQVSMVSDLVGSTPAVRLPSLFEEGSSPFVKLEKFNPGGSIKDRVALYVIQELERQGLIQPGKTIVESSSGNLGIGLALHGAQRGYRVVIVVDQNTSKQNISIMHAYGAEIVIETELDDCGLYHKTKLARAKAIATQTNGYWVNQTANELNSQAHEQTTGAEISSQFGRFLDVCVLATSSGGQLAGVARALKAASPETKILAVDAKGSSIFSSKPHTYITPGLGLSWYPKILEPSLVDWVCLVDDRTAFEVARFLASKGLMLGPSSGAVAAACYRAQKAFGAKTNVLGLAPDGGERYLDTLFDDRWMAKQGFSPKPSSYDVKRRILELQLHEQAKEALSPR
ncbi:PLP-dependent cysteine synthase family protein [Pseudomonas putida]|uniref:PLP-dependent cysteine synthase family protein n=1 Tax=Pseudomonas putida TaxID=303 RepID=UPI002363A1FF|nr:cysteine synthase family protein [Pseudomonas putida]MDD2102988.1 cysteine synthase family protein [Pseudomonas putida]